MDSRLPVRIEATTFADLLLKAADRDPEATAVVFGDARRSYAELVKGATDIARGLKALGVKRGDHVGLLLPNGLDFIDAFFAVALCGAVAVLINARYRPSELAYVTRNADVVTIVTTGAVADALDFSQRLTEAFPVIADAADPLALAIDGVPFLRNIVLLGSDLAPGCIDAAQFRALAEQVPETAIDDARAAVRIRDVGMILYTSGTSSNPKGCLITHEAMVRNSINLGRERWQYRQGERVWSPLPLFHVAALSALLSSIDAGGTFIGHERFDPGESLRAIERERATIVFLPFVTFLQAMLHHPDFSTTDLSSVRVMNSCFAAMPASVGTAFAQAMPGTMQVGTFGMSEACGVVATGGPGMDPALGFSRLGHPLAGIELRIVDRETGADLPTGEQGEVLIRGYSLFEGYYKDPDKTAEALDGDGWYHSGDIGSLEANGHIMFHGRMKDMLKVGGENVAAAEVEAVLARYPGVQLAQVVGIPDARLSEVPAAFIGLVEGAEVSADDLIAYCRKEIASFKVPRVVRFVEEWPMSASKVQKFRLRALLMEEFNLVD
ncbi:AMP-dependent synthetase [Sphingomonas populi]|uniref:AMP-dependent synthetase n=1 Tax=Sphingomonas populi TaxID=2484750 RepID=A0A4Q6Y2Z8_9SPHN|nr:class I adenylate-forming enzyme family protein [Sphingomonas populi]RZF63657.1 AMP-dependent synthetase [Sphingomonas populi]